MTKWHFVLHFIPVHHQSIIPLFHHSIILAFPISITPILHYSTIPPFHPDHLIRFCTNVIARNGRQSLGQTFTHTACLSQAKTPCFAALSFLRSSKFLSLGSNICLLIWIEMAGPMNSGISSILGQPAWQQEHLIQSDDRFN
jgi:hypothetical protein